MRSLAKWHIWLGWLVGVPIVIWTLSGLVMVIKPIEEVRGNHLRVTAEPQALPPGNPVPIAFQLSNARPIREFRTRMQGARPVTTVTYMDGRTERYDARKGTPIDTMDEGEARELVAGEVVGGDEVASARLYAADKPPFDFRREIAVWQVALEDGTHVYVGADTGEIEAVRTRWWRIFDFMWGLHIMDLQTREDTSHPILIIFAALSLLGSLIGTVLLFRRRRRRVTA